MNSSIENLMKLFRSRRDADRINEVSHLLFEIEQPFNSLYDEGLKLSETPDRGHKRRARFYNLINIVNSVEQLDGAVVECGCWRGLSSYLICQFIRINRPEFSGADYHIFDSFEGLSTPSPEDRISINLVDSHRDRTNTFFKSAGAYSASLEHVKRVLADFPEVEYHKGWLPGSLDEMKIPRIKFLHIDLDLYEPIAGVLKSLYPHVIPGGVIVCDDYGSLYWPGAKKAVEEFTVQSGARFISLSSGQAVLIKK
jgi:O-methyltransferase